MDWVWVLIAIACGGSVLRFVIPWWWWQRQVAGLLRAGKEGSDGSR